MQIIPLKYPFTPFPDISSSVLAIGYFDGIHIGHAEVIEEAKKTADEKGLPCGVMTFDPHPRDVLGKAEIRSYLTPLEEKLRCFRSFQLDYVFIVEFDLPFSEMSPEAFVDNVLFPLQVVSAVVGFDFTFGHRGKGTSETLKQLGRGRFDVRIVEPIKYHGEKVSSTLIREQLYEGYVDRLPQYLGRLYAIEGTVIHGDGRGRTIGFPTANIQLAEPYMIPKHGVYSVRAYVDHRTYYGVMNIGTKPTFSEGKSVTLEVHLLDYSGDLYGQTIRIEFLQYLRSEKKFSGIEALIEQIHNDIRKVRDGIASQA